jgi:nucleoside-diphosphate kinase
MNKENLISPETPKTFGNRNLAQVVSKGIRGEEIVLSEAEDKRLLGAIEFLNNPELDRMIEAGQITLAMIKPKASESRNLSPKDQKAANMIMSEIGEENVLFDISLCLSPQDVEVFYQGNPYLKKIQEHYKKGSATFLLIYREQGDAVKWWRDRIGATVPEKADQNSIRGKYALSVSNNLVHGSDSEDSVKREKEVLKNIIIGLQNISMETRESNPCFKAVNFEELMCPKDELLAFGVNSRGRERFSYTAIVQDSKGAIERRRLCVETLARAS